MYAKESGRKRQKESKTICELLQKQTWSTAVICIHTQTQAGILLLSVYAYTNAHFKSKKHR